MRLNDRSLTASSILLTAALSAALLGCAPDRGDQVEREIQRQLGDDSRAVQVEIDGGTATLTGAVQNRSSRTISEEIVLAQPGIKSVENRVTVPERQPMERMYMKSVDDGMLMRVEFFLLRRVGPGAIKRLQARAADGIVSIRGPVPSEAVHQAIVETVASVEDVRQVVDLMTVAAADAPAGIGTTPVVTPTK